MKPRARSIKTILQLLKKAYPNAKIVLNFSNQWELLVAVILSAQCTDKKVNEVTEKLFKKYRTLDDYMSADSREFEKMIRPTGFYRAKAKNILASARIVKEKFGGKLPTTMEEMLTLKGVARKTANIVLGNAYGIVEGIAVDTHVRRLSQRLGLTPLETHTKTLRNRERKAKPPDGSLRVVSEDTRKFLTGQVKHDNPEKIEQDLMRLVPKNDWFRLTYLLIDHGRAICTAKDPRCDFCPLNKVCPSAFKFPRFTKIK